MAKNTAVIDIGSNSVRMVIFQKSSRFAFHIVHEAKCQARISESMYKNYSYLQQEPMRRASAAIGDFLDIAKNYSVRKILCVGTSALRDAKNAHEFIKEIKNSYKLDIKVIDGTKEAYYCGIACANLLPSIDSAITVDIGGGSCEISLLNNGKIISNHSLDIGTVRIKELYLDRGDIDGAISYIDSQIASLNLSTTTIIGVGGSFRNIAKSIMKTDEYPLKKLHGYRFSAKKLLQVTKDIYSGDDKKLKKLHIKSERADTIGSGALILERIALHQQCKDIISSGVGVREGLYLSDLLRNNRGYFPSNYNPSVRSIIDRFSKNSQISINNTNLTKQIFTLTHKHLNIDIRYKGILSIASKLMDIGSEINIYSGDSHSSYIAINALNYALEHSDIALISHLLLFKKETKSSDIKTDLAELLPSKSVLNSLHFILWLSHTINKNQNIKTKPQLSFENSKLSISGINSHLLQQEIKNLVIPKEITIKLED